MPDSTTRKAAPEFLGNPSLKARGWTDRMIETVGVAEAYVSIKHKVLAAIATAYPNLAAECKRQRGRRV